MQATEMVKIGRNDKCPCGSDKKYKKCCLVRYNHFSSEQDYLEIENYELFECLINSNYEEAGIASILVVRKQPNHKFTYGVYLLDIYCMGLKNTTLEFDVSYEKVKLVKSRLSDDLEDLSFEKTRSIIFGGIDYAKKIGFEPALDWERSQYIVGSQRPYIDDYEFGFEGKPNYVQGPNDNVVKIMKTLNLLNRDEYNFSLVVSSFDQRGMSNIPQLDM